jgi:hypothetical protein
LNSFLVLYYWDFSRIYTCIKHHPSFQCYALLIFIILRTDKLISHLLCLSNPTRSMLLIMKLASCLDLLVDSPVMDFWNLCGTLVACSSTLNDVLFVHSHDNLTVFAIHDIGSILARKALTYRLYKQVFKSLRKRRSHRDLFQPNQSFSASPIYQLVRLHHSSRWIHIPPPRHGPHE